MTKGRIVEYITKREKPELVRSRYCAANTQVWLIEYKEGCYFHSCYELKVTAARVKDRLDGTVEEMNANGISDPENCMYFPGTIDKIDGLVQ